jgi:hypothetical protein
MTTNTATTARPYTVHVLNARGMGLWTGSRTKSFGSLEAATEYATRVLPTVENGHSAIVKFGGIWAGTRVAEITNEATA